MALGRKGKTQTGKLVVLKITTRDKDKKDIPPCFVVSEKGVDGKYHAREKTETAVEGDLVKIEVKDQEWEGEKYNTVAIYLVDGDELFLIDARVNMLTRSLFNSLLSLKTFERVTISLYTFKKKDKKTGKDAEYPAVSVWQNEEQVMWSVPIAEQPKPVVINLPKGKVQNDYTDCDDFFLAKLREFSKVVDAAAKASTKNKKEAPANTVSANTPADSAEEQDAGGDPEIPDGAPF